MESYRDKFNSSYKVADNSCWLWLKYLDKDGYGRPKIKQKPQRSNRVSWMLHFGEIPEGMLVCHKCDNPSCVNPEHLFLGTAQDNTRDMFSKGRASNRKGSNHGQCRLSESDIKAIRNDDRTAGIIASQYNIHPRHVYRIKSGERWGHIDGVNPTD